MAKVNNKIDFHKKLILFKYILNLFRINSIEEIAQNIKDSYYEEIDLSTNHTRFYQAIISKFGVFDEDIGRWGKSKWGQCVFADDKGEYLSRAQLEQYDENIISFTKQISEKRDLPLKWKYFQYLELLFTEIYLDKYFSNKENLLNSLNVFLEKYNNENLKKEEIAPYEEKDLNKLAFWAATGSGKTLILHMNILQFKYYAKKYKKENAYNRLILVTPNEGLSKQHEKEFRQSDINAKIFEKQSGISNNNGQLGFFNQQTTKSNFIVDIVEITKLGLENGDKTVAVDSFESNNIVFVDEGHRGASGNVWKNYRDKLSIDGFCFEYSATFGQVISKDNKLIQEYAKCILFDYSYKYFYKDGYGKDYQILNLDKNFDGERKQQYLTACLLSYFQQVLLYKNKKTEFVPFLIENPLWIFVGASVIGNQSNEKKLSSDVIDILLFINDFVSNKNISVEFLNNLINKKDAFLNSQGLRIFENKFNYLLDCNYNGESLFKDIIKLIFNCENSANVLHIENLKGVDGEIGLRLGDNDYFGVINVGDNDSLIKLCDANGLITSSKDFSESLFHSLNNKDSKINLLIGSKKFSEGWSSWRVSTMGLMNIGKSEGSQIIQLFGRGVRLKGANFSLKRSGYQEFIARTPKFISYMETLNIFGIKADYMAQFKAYLEEEGLPTGEFIDLQLPVISNLGRVKTPLKMPRLKEGLNFKKDAEAFDLDLPPQTFLQAPIILDLYSQIQIKESKTSSSEKIEKEKHKLNNEHLQFIDYQSLYFEIQKFKNEKNYYNMNISFEKIKEILNNDTWYELRIPISDLEFTDFSKVIKYQDIATRLLKKYCEKYFTFKQNAWESQYREYAVIDDENPNMLKEYKVYIEQSKQDIIIKMKDLQEKLKNKSGNYSLEFGNLVAFDWENHLFTPLISYIENDGLKIVPVALNPSEIQFVKDLKKFYDENSSYFDNKEMYLLRNQSKGKGVGFFEANNFYPDFVLWLIKDGKQFISFIDPKGIMKMPLEHSKIQFFRTIKDIQQQMNDESIILNSFILSNTPYESLNLVNGYIPKEEYRNNNVIFQQEKDYIQYIFNLIR